MGDSKNEPCGGLASCPDVYEGLTVDEMVECAMIIAGAYDEHGEPDFTY